MYEKQDKAWKTVKYELLESYCEELEEKLKEAEEKIKKLTEGLEVITTFVCIPDEDTEEQVMATHRMCGDLLDKVNEQPKGATINQINRSLKNMFLFHKLCKCEENDTENKEKSNESI